MSDTAHVSPARDSGAAAVGAALLFWFFRFLVGFYVFTGVSHACDINKELWFVNRDSF